MAMEIRWTKRTLKDIARHREILDNRIDGEIRVDLEAAGVFNSQNLLYRVNKLARATEKCTDSDDFLSKCVEHYALKDRDYRAAAFHHSGLVVIAAVWGPQQGCPDGVATFVRMRVEEEIPGAGLRRRTTFSEIYHLP